MTRTTSKRAEQALRAENKALRNRLENAQRMLASLSGVAHEQAQRQEQADAQAADDRAWFDDLEAIRSAAGAFNEAIYDLLNAATERAAAHVEAGGELATLAESARLATEQRNAAEERLSVLTRDLYDARARLAALDEAGHAPLWLRRESRAFALAIEQGGTVDPKVMRRLWRWVASLAPAAASPVEVTT